MKLTLIGKPLDKVVVHDSHVTFEMSGKPPQSMPGGLPKPPSGPPLTWTVLLSLKQWNRVKGTVYHPDDKLILDGYPCRQGDTLILLVQGCQSVLQQQAKKEAQREASSAQVVA